MEGHEGGVGRNRVCLLDCRLAVPEVSHYLKVSGGGGCCARQGIYDGYDLLWVEILTRMEVRHIATLGWLPSVFLKGPPQRDFLSLCLQGPDTTADANNK